MKIIHHQKIPSFSKNKIVHIKSNSPITSPQKKILKAKKIVFQDNSPNKELSLFFLSWEVKLDKRFRIINGKIFLILFILFVFLIAFGLFSENYLFSILIILAGLIFYLFENEKPFLFWDNSRGYSD